MASWGWRVTAIDVLPDALEIAKGLEKRYRHPEAPWVEWRLGDLEAGALELGSGYGLVTCFRYLKRDLIRRAQRLLSPGGSLAVETFTEVHRERFGKPRRKEFVLAVGELPGLAEGLEVVEFAEGWQEGAHTARLWARNER